MIVNALRKFESAGVIESRSSGMKGTYIKVVNDVVFEELEELKRGTPDNTIYQRIGMFKGTYIQNRSLFAF